MRTRVLILTLAMAAMGLAARSEAAGYLGGGVHYWRTIDQIRSSRNLDDSGIAWMATGQYSVWRLLKIEADLEVFPKGFGGADRTAYAPQAYLLFGSTLYAGAGVGVVYSSDFSGSFSDPFYALKTGLDLEVLPRLHLDVNANYQFLNWKDVNSLQGRVNTDTITLGAAVRLEF